MIMKPTYEQDVIRGVDGCKAGWLSLAIKSGNSFPTATVHPDARSLFSETAAITAIDIPIGLAASGTRRVDSRARSCLGPLKSSVFTAPVRAVLSASSYSEACAISLAVCGKKISQQTFGILPKIREVDLALRTQSELIDRVFEVHPEVCFVHWNGNMPLRHPKTSGFGFMERLSMVQQVFGDAPKQVRDAVRRTQVSDDDILDAFAALWTAQRISTGCAARLVEKDERDDVSLPMQMWA
jgi:predicted RNase H-like nuclease